MCTGLVSPPPSVKRAKKSLTCAALHFVGYCLRATDTSEPNANAAVLSLFEVACIPGDTSWSDQRGWLVAGEMGLGGAGRGGDAGVSELVGMLARYVTRDGG